MAIEINDSSNYTAYPIIKHQQIGQSCNLSVIRFEQRDRLRKDPVTNQMVKIPNGLDRNNQPKFKQELVIHCVFASGDMVAALGDHAGVPAAGDRVRVILKGRSFVDWIEAKKAHRGGRFHVGDGMILSTTHAQQYDQNGNPKGGKLERQAEAAAVPRNVTIGFYGTLQLVASESASWAAEMVGAAETAYRADEAAKRQQQAIQLPAGEAEEAEEEYS
jgi:hypothetical protein